MMSFEQMVVYFGAPALCGLKSANLISVDPKENSAQKILAMNAELSALGKKMVLIPRSPRPLLFVYDEHLLRRTLCGKAQMRYLAQKGYPIQKGMAAILQDLFFRLASQQSFPHEIGLFLGYPFEDVLGFEEHRGRNCKYTGCWKVYGDVASACRLMEVYKQCSVECCRYFDGGMNISSISRQYHVRKR